MSIYTWLYIHSTLYEVQEKIYNYKKVKEKPDTICTEIWKKRGKAPPNQ